MSYYNPLPPRPLFNSMRQTFTWEQDTCSRFVHKLSTKGIKEKVGIMILTKANQMVIKVSCPTWIIMWRCDPIGYNVHGMVYRWPSFQRPCQPLKQQWISLMICIVHLRMYNLKNIIQELLNWINELKPILNRCRVKLWWRTNRIIKPLVLDILWVGVPCHKL